MEISLWLQERGIRKGVGCWFCEHCLRHHPEKWTLIEHSAECPNADLVRQRYAEVERREATAAR